MRNKLINKILNLNKNIIQSSNDVDMNDTNKLYIKLSEFKN